MSCHWRFECLSHEPHILSEDFASHTGNADYKDHIALARQRPLDMSIDDVIERDYWNQYERNTHVFLIQHENCELGIVDEYGVHKTLDEGDPIEEDNKPYWYRMSSRGIALLQCTMCIALKMPDVEQASTIWNGNALCYKHVGGLAPS